MERRIAWNSYKKYDIREFAELFYDRLPLIARIEDLKENDGHDIRPHEESVYLVHSVHLQPRIVARTEQNEEQFVTFPHSYPFKFHVVQTDGSISEPLTVNEILNNRKQDPKGTRIRMARREELTLSESGVTCDVFGTLVIGGTYNEKYLLVVRLTSEGSSVSNDFRLTALPTYLPLVVTLPFSADGRLQKNLAEYQRDLKASVSVANYEENAEELLIFSHPPDDDEYEMVFPSTLLAVSDHRDTRRFSRLPESVVEQNEANPTNLPARAEGNKLSDITSPGFKKRDDSPETTPPDKCSLLVQKSETIYEDIPRRSSSRSSDISGAPDNSDNGKDEHVFERYTDIPELLLADEVSEPPPLPAKHHVGRSSAKICPEPRLDMFPAAGNNPRDLLIEPTDKALPLETEPNRRNNYQSSETRVRTTLPRLPCRPSTKMENTPIAAVASDRPLEPLAQNKANKSPWYRFPPFRKRSSEKGKRPPGLRKFRDVLAEKSSDNNFRSELQPETLASTKGHQPLCKSASCDRYNVKTGLSVLRNLISSNRCEAAADAKTPHVAAETTSSVPLMPEEATANQTRKNRFFRSDKRIALHRNQVKSKAKSETPIPLDDCPNRGPTREKISNCDSKPTDQPSNDAIQVRPKFDRDSGFSCDESSCGSPRLSLTVDSQMNSNIERPGVFTRLADVPSDLSSLTVSGVANCLSLLNLGQYIHLFREQDVDGDLLSCLDLDILMQDFGLKRFDAIKLSKFIRDGWRPRTEPGNQVP